MKKSVLAIAMFVAVATLVFGCKDEDVSANVGQLKVYLVSALTSYDSVVVVVREVSVQSERHGWVVLNNTMRTFDLLQLTNGARPVLAERSLDAGSYTQVRLLLDTGCYVAAGGRRWPLSIRDGVQAETKLASRVQVGANMLNELYLDFDANGDACACECCRQFKSVLHVSTSLEILESKAQGRLKACKALDRCKCGDRWDHRHQSGKHCRHCASNNEGSIG